MYTSVDATSVETACVVINPCCRNARESLPAQRSCAYHVERALVIVLLHELNLGFLFACVLAHFHVLHSPLIVGHIPPS